MKKSLLSLALVLVLVGLMVMPVMADAPGDQPITASVTVTEYVSVTVTDNGTGGLDFGSLIPGSLKQTEAASPSVIIETAAENNKDVEVYLKGTDFTGIVTTETFSITNAFYHDSPDAGSALTMPDDYDTTAWKTLGADQTLNIYHWLSVPLETTADTYDSTFTYKTQAS